MSIIKKPYEIAVYDDVLQDNNTFQEVRLGIIGSDKMEGQNRVQEPNFVRNINGQNTLTFKMYKTYTDIVTGEKVDNPFCDWLVSERKVKLHYEDKWYDFIVKDIQEESTNYLYSYSLEDANVQELSRNGFGVILDAELMNNVGDAAALGTKVMKETNWTISGDVAVQTVEEALVYIQTTQSFTAKHVLDQENSDAGVTISGTDTDIDIGEIILGFYSSCKSKPNRFQFIYASSYDNLPTDSNRIIKLEDCQYYIDFSTPEEDYGSYDATFDLYLPNGMSVYNNISGDTPISTKYRGARYGFAQQAQYVPLLDRYCQKFNADTTIPVQFGQLEVYNSYTTNPSATDSIIISSDGSLATGFSGTINSIDGGVALNIDYNSVDTYFIEFALEKTEGVLNNIGGYCDSFRVESYEVFSDSARTDKIAGTYDDDTDTFAVPSGVNPIYVTAKYHKIVNENDTTPYIFIQPNRGDDTSVTVTVSNLTVKNKGDYFGYTDSEYISPTLIQNVINNYNFESDAGWTATYTDQVAGAEKSTVTNLFGRFDDSSPAQFKSIVDDFLDGTYSDDNIYLPYMQMDLKSTSHFVLNSGMCDNRTMIKNLSEGEEWVLDYRILNSAGAAVATGLTFDLAEYIYNTSTGGYSKKNDKVVFSKSAASTVGNNQRIIFTVKSNGYTEATFKKNSRIYLKIQSGSAGTYYIQHIALYRLVRDEDGNIIEPDYEEKQSAAAQDWIDKSKLNHKYCYFNAWEVNPDNPYICGDVESLPITTTDTLDYTKYKATYNEDARKVRAVTVKESNYFNILQTIGETFEQWLTINVDRDASGAITGKSISFKNYRGDDNYACFRYGVNLKDITRTFTSKEIVTKLIVKQNSNQLADNGFCTIQRAAANTTGEDYIYDFQYYQNRGLMDGAAYLQQNYYLTSAVGPDAELWGSSGPVQPSDAPNLNGCFPRIKKINDAIIPLNEEVSGLKIDLTQRRSELTVAEAANEAAISGIEEVREDFQALTGVYPEDIIERPGNENLAVYSSLYMPPYTPSASMVVSEGTETITVTNISQSSSDNNCYAIVLNVVYPSGRYILDFDYYNSSNQEVVPKQVHIVSSVKIDNDYHNNSSLYRGWGLGWYKTVTLPYNFVLPSNAKIGFILPNTNGSTQIVKNLKLVRTVDIRNITIVPKQLGYNITAQATTNIEENGVKVNVVSQTIKTEKLGYSPWHPTTGGRWSDSISSYGITKYDGYKYPITIGRGGGFYEASKRYSLSYTVEVKNGIQTISCGTNDFNDVSCIVQRYGTEDSYTIEFDDNASQYKNINNGNILPAGTYQVIITGTYRGSTNRYAGLQIALDTQDSGPLTMKVLRDRKNGISLSKITTIQGTSVNYDRYFGFTLGYDIYVLDKQTGQYVYKKNIYIDAREVFPAGKTETELTYTIPTVDLTRNDVQKYLTKYTTYLEEKQRTDAELPVLRNIVSQKESDIRNKQAYIKQLYYYKQLINNLFFSKYSRFIQEGTWIDEEYTDDEKYYADALSVLYNSCYPQVAYSINVLELSKLPGYELFKFDVGDKTWAIDDDFFGEGIKEEVIITELSENLDDPSQNNIKVQNFKNQFQDLFQAITATVQQTQYSSGAYEKGAALVDADEDYKSRFIIDAVNNASSFLAPGRSHTVSWEGGNGITVTDDTIPTNQVRIVGGAILFSAIDPRTQEQTWVTGVTNEGISANLITAGRLDTGAIQIMSGDEAVFRWDAFGLSAYDAFWQDGTQDGQNGIITGVNTKKFVRFDKFGIYGIDNYLDDGVLIDGATWHPKNNEEIDKKATFALTWQGLKVTHPIANSNDSAVMRIGKFGDAPQRKIFEVTKGSDLMMSFDEKGEFIVGGWHLYDNGLSYGSLGSDESVWLTPAGIEISGIQNVVIGAGANFKVTSSGALYATGATISGTINADSGTFSGGINIGNYSATQYLKITDNGIEAHDEYWDSGNYENTTTITSQGLSSFVLAEGGSSSFGCGMIRGKIQIWDGSSWRTLQLATNTSLGNYIRWY